MSDQIPLGAIPVDEFQEAPQASAPPVPGAIPVDQFEEEGELPNELKKYGSTAEQVKAGLEEAAKAGTLGLSTAIERGFGAKPEDIQGREAANEILHPNLKTAENVAGFASSALIPGLGEANIVSDIGHGAQALTGLGVEGAGVLSHMGGMAARMGAETALMQSGDEVSKYFAGNPDNSQTALANIGLSGLIGGVVGAPLGAVSPLWKAAKGTELGQKLFEAKDSMLNNGIGGFAKKLLSTLGGVDEKNINEYILDREGINSTPEKQQIYDHYLPHIEQIHSDLAEKKISANEAADALKEVERNFKNDLTQNKFEATIANNTAKQAMKTATTELLAKAQEDAINSAPTVTQAYNELFQNAIQKSKESFHLVENKEVSLKDFFERGQSLIDDVRKGKTDNAEKIADNLDKFLVNVGENNPEKIAKGDQVKKMIQALDRDSNYNLESSPFDKGMSGYYKQLRYELDNALKKASPEYARAMEPIASDFQLINKLGRYGDEVSASKKINSLKNPVNFKYEIPLLEQLEQKTGYNFTKNIKTFADKDIKDAMIKALPEYAEASKTANILTALKNPETMRALEEAVANTPEFKAHQQAMNELKDALVDKENLHGLTPTNLESKLNAAMRGTRNVEKAIKNLPAYEDKSLNEVLEKLKVKQSLQGGRTNGSKNVNLFGGILGGLGGLLGGHVLGGIGVGAAVGSYMDKHGADVVKKVLDFYIDHADLQRLTNVSDKGILRSALAKVIDHGGDISANGFKSMVQSMSQSYQGKKIIDQNSKSLFKKEKLKTLDIPNKQTVKLDDKIKQIQDNPDELSKIANEIQYYMPEHGQSLNNSAISAISYLVQSRPKNAQAMPFDKKILPNKMQENAYNRKLQIAENPMIIYEHIKNGTLINQDVVAINSMFPGLANQMKSSIQQEMIQAKNDKVPFPYHQMNTISMFIGEPLNSSQTPQGIQSILMASGNQSTPETGQNKAKNKATGVQVKSMDKIAALYQTPSQAREANRKA